MKQRFLVFSLLAILLSCSQADNKTASESVIDTLPSLTKDSSGYLSEKSSPLKRKCSYDNEVASLGLGLVIAPSKFDIYNDSLLTDKLASRDMYSDDDTLVDICPKFFEPDYGIMHFVCTGQTEKAYKVLINYSQLKYLPKKKEYKFQSWEQYITTSMGIRRLTADQEEVYQSTEPLRKEPQDGSDTLSIPEGYELFCPMEVKGDWVKVKYDCFYNLEENKYEGQPCHNYITKCKNPVTGWLRWRRSNKVLIEILLMP